MTSLPSSADALTLLLAPGQLSHLLGVRARVVGDPGLSIDALADAWRAAGPIWQALFKREAGAADQARTLPLPPETRAHIEALVACPGVRRTFEVVPVGFALAPIDALVSSQLTLTHSTLAALAPAGRALPSLQEQLALCLPLAPDAGPQALRVVHQSAQEIVLVADSHDVRLLGTQALEGAALGTVDVRGHLQVVAGALLGQSVNLVNVISHQGRLVLNNGHHRVEALRRLGARHVPCLVQVCPSREEVMEVASREVRENYGLYFETPRPPLLRDFAVPGLSCTLRTPRMRREIRVSISVDSRMVAC